MRLASKESTKERKKLNLVERHARGAEEERVIDSQGGGLRTTTATLDNNKRVQKQSGF